MAAVKRLGYRGVHLGNQVSFELQARYWDEGKLSARARLFSLADYKPFVLRKGTTDPYQYGPLPAFLAIYSLLLDGRQEEASDNENVRTSDLFLSSPTFLSRLCACLPQDHTYKVPIGKCEQCHEGFHEKDSHTRCSTCRFGLRTETKGYLEKRILFVRCRDCLTV